MAVSKISKRKKKHVKSQDVQLVAQEIKFARVLAGNDKRSRDKILKTLKKWFRVRFDKGNELKEEDFARIWKGLFYAVWMSDKPLVQEELCEEIAGVLDLFPASQAAAAACALFVQAGLRVLAAEWFGIDHHRIDKFLMLVRRVVRGVFRWVRRCGWSAWAADAVGAALGGAGGLLSVARPPPPHARNALALQLHLADCYLEELAKVADDRISGECVARLAAPLVRYMALGQEPRLCAAIKKAVFTFLFRQSDMGQEYEAKKRAWTKAGCPSGGPEAMQKVEDSDEDEDEDAKEEKEDSGSDDDTGGGGALDPRAGRVDVVLHALPVPCRELAQQLHALATAPGTCLASRHRVRRCIALLQEYERGVYPLRLRRWEGEGEAQQQQQGESLRLPRARSAALRLLRVERALTHGADELCVRGLSRKHKKRVMSRRSEPPSLPAPAGDAAAGAGDGAPPAKKKKSTAKGNNSGQWQVEDTEPIKKLQLAAEGNKSGKENEPQKKKLKRRKKNNKSPTTLQDEVPLKKLKTLMKEKEGPASANVRVNALKEKNKHARATKKTSLHELATKEKPVVNGQQNVTNGAAAKESEKTKRAKVQHKNNKPKKLLRSLQKAIGQSDKTNKIKPIGQTDGRQNKMSKAVDSDKKILGSSKKSSTVQNTPMKVASGAKKVKFLLKNISAQAPLDYYKSVRRSPSIPFEPSKKPQKTNLKPSTPSPINPFFKKKLKLNL